MTIHRRHKATLRDLPGIPEPTVVRLPAYLRALTDLVSVGVPTVSSDQLAQAAGVHSATLRKDLSLLGSYGVRGVGYDVGALADQITCLLGLSEDWPVAIIGMGNLGHALANYAGFVDRGFRIAALFDAVVNHEERLNNLPVHPMEDLDQVLVTEKIAIAVIAVPASAAQTIADRLVAAGVTSILNFAPVTLQVPRNVQVRKVDLSSELHVLAFHEQRRAVSPLVTSDQEPVVSAS